MKAKDVMTAPVVSIEPGAPVLQAVQTMLQRHISGLLVIERDGNLVGMVTEGDFLRRIETGTQHRRPRWFEFLVGPGRLANEYTNFHARKVKDVMTREPLTVNEETPIEQVVDLIEKHRIKRVPVVRGRHVVGIISRANLLQALASLSPEAQPSTQDDENIRSLLLAEFERQGWAHMPLVYVNPIVLNGIVELWGTITDERERQAFIVAAENVPGVKAVRDHLVPFLVWL
jgi:CBS domain-containing protein